MQTYRWLPASAFVLCAALCACGGSGTPPLSSSDANARFVFEVPLPSSQAAQSAVRKPAYISSATQSLSVSLTTVNGSTPSPVPAAQTVNVASSTNGCGTDPNHAGDVLCTIAINLPVGTDVVNVAAYDAQNATGDLLSQQAYSAAVVAGTANSYSFTLDANPANATLSVTSPGGSVTGTQGGGFTIPSSAGAQNFTLSLTDAAGQTIVGPGAPSPSASSSATSAATVSLSGNTLTITPIAAGNSTITVGEAPANSQGAGDGLSAGSTQFGVTIQSGLSASVFYAPTSPAAVKGGIAYYNGTVYAAATLDGSTYNAYTITGGSPTLAGSVGGANVRLAAVASNGVYWDDGTSVCSPSDSVGLLGQSALPDSFCISAITANGSTLYGYQEDAPDDTGSVNTSNGSLQFGNDYFSLSYGSNPPSYLATNTGNTFYASNGSTLWYLHGNNAVTTLSWTGLGSPKGLALDASGDLFVADAGGKVWKVGTPSGTPSPVAEPAPSGGWSAPTDLTYDAADDILYVVDTGLNQIIEIGQASTASSVARRVP